MLGRTHFKPSRDMNSILHLQRTIGNQAVQKLLRSNAEKRKLGLSGTNSPHFGHDFRRISARPRTVDGIQMKLAINKPGDEYEREADRVAEQVMRMPEPMFQRACACGGACPKCKAEQLSQEHGRLQIKSVRASDAGPVAALPVVYEVLKSPGQPIDPATRGFMGSRFGHDFSRMRVHTDKQAAQSAADVGACAYTVEQHMVFGAGEYAPGTNAGKSLIAHELVHALQQPQGGTFLQRLIRSPYPWLGVITPSRGANIRSAPDSRDPTNILDSIPRGEIVRVLSVSGNWLRVESRYRGPALVGYIHHTLVDDATSSSMAGSVGTQMVWRPSGRTSGTTFESWASAATETPFPVVTPATVMNCWEAVLLSAYRAGAINWNWIHNLYASTPPANWITAMSRGARHTYQVPGPNLRMPQRGDLVFFDGLAHVALATGNGSEVFTFWPPPDTPFTPGGTLDRVKVFTIEALNTWWTAHMPPAPTVEFAAPAW